MSRVVAGLRSQYVQFPDIEEGNHIAKSLYKDTNFLGIVGIIDRTHVQIMKPHTKNPIPERFYNRKSRYSLNC